MAALEGDSQLSESTISWDYSGDIISPDILTSELLRNVPSIMAASLQYETVTPKNIGHLKSLNSVLFPMAYQDKYYKEVLAQDSLARLCTLQLLAADLIFSVLAEATGGNLFVQVASILRRPETLYGMLHNDFWGSCPIPTTEAG
jgi:hypothetical protein